MSKISIIMPTYNVEGYLKECLSSVIAQTFTDLEIIVVNDGSTDQSGAIADEFAMKDSRIKVIHQKNGGYGVAINTGLTAAKGDYIGIVETDDYIAPHMYEILYRRAIETNAQIVKTGFIAIFEGQETKFSYLQYLENKTIFNPIDFPQFVCGQSAIWSALYKRNFIEEHHIRMIETKGASYQDVGWKLMTYLLAEQVHYVDDYLYYYRQFRPNSSSVNKTNPLITFENYRCLKDFLIKKNIFSRDAVQRIYYLNHFFDFVFHYERLSSTSKKQFKSEANKFIKQYRKTKLDVFRSPQYSKKFQKYIQRHLQTFIFLLEFAPIWAINIFLRTKEFLINIKKSFK